MGMERRRQRQVHRGEGRGHVERDAVLVREHRTM